MNHGTWKSTAVFAGALLIASDIGASAEGGSVTTAVRGKSLAISTNTIQVLHRPLQSMQSLEPFTHALEKILGHFPEGVQQDVIEQPQRAQERLKAAEGAQELMVFLVFDHGAALNMVGARRNAKQYLIGNPLTAIQMSQHDIRAALYAPLRVLVYEPKGRANNSGIRSTLVTFRAVRTGRRYTCCSESGSVSSSTSLHRPPSWRVADVITAHANTSADACRGADRHDWGPDWCHVTQGDERDSADATRDGCIADRGRASFFSRREGVAQFASSPVAANGVR